MGAGPVDRSSGSPPAAATASSRPSAASCLSAQRDLVSLPRPGRLLLLTLIPAPLAPAAQARWAHLQFLEPAFCLLPHRQGSLRLVAWHWGCLCSSPAVPGHARGGTDPAAWCGPAPAPPACRALGWRSVTHCEHNQCQTCTQPLPATLPEGETMFIPKNTKHLPPAFVYFFKRVGGLGEGGGLGDRLSRLPGIILSHLVCRCQSGECLLCSGNLTNVEKFKGRC